MPFERSAGAVIFRKEESRVYYLLLHYQSGHWDFPKGNIEKGEKLAETVKREIKEETGLEDIKFILGFKEAIKYFYRSPRSGKTASLKGERQKPKVSGVGVGVSRRKIIFKIVTFFLVRTKTKEVKISWEHTGFQWLPYEEAMEQITFKNAKEILQKANNFLSEKGSQRG